MKKTLLLLLLLLGAVVSPCNGQQTTLASKNNVPYICDAYITSCSKQIFLTPWAATNKPFMVCYKPLLLQGFNLCTMENEIWKSVKGYEGCYEVSSWGNMRSLDRWRTNGKVPILIKGVAKSIGDNDKGYLNINVCNQDKKKCLYVHRLVGIAFVPNPLNLPEINHLDGNKSNNYYKNLEWCTRKQNCRHQWDVLGQVSPMKGLTNELHFNSKPTFQYDLQGNFIKEYTCAADAARQINGNKFNICMICREPFYAPGKRKTHKGFYWSREKLSFT